MKPRTVWITEPITGHEGDWLCLSKDKPKGKDARQVTIVATELMERMKEMLDDLEWGDLSSEGTANRCPQCTESNFPKPVHDKDCDLGALLQELGEG